MDRSKILSSLLLAIFLTASTETIDSALTENQLPKLEGISNAEQVAIDKSVAKV